MRILTTVVALGAVLATPSIMGQSIKETNTRVTLVDGNQLYGWCIVAQKVTKPSGQGAVESNGTVDELVSTASCWSYIEGVIDTTPVGGEFNPGPTVRLSQYVDVITEYLRVHANIRNRGASALVQSALKESFSHP
jgi:hypothetical protein